MDPIELRHSTELDSFLSEFGSRNRLKRNSTASIRSHSRSRKNSLQINDKTVEEETVEIIPSGAPNVKNNNNNNNINSSKLSLWRSHEFQKIQILPPSEGEKCRVSNNNVSENGLAKDLESGSGGLQGRETDSLKGKKGNGLDPDLEDDDLGDDDLETEKGAGAHKFTGLGLALLSCLAFSLSSLIIKYMKDYHPFSKCVWRFQGLVVPAIPMMIFSAKCRKERIFETVWPVCHDDNWKNILYLVLRSTAGFATIIFQFFALQYITLADQMVLASSQPVFVGIMAYFMLGEKCGFVPFGICCLTILGVVIVAKPPILTGAESYNTDVLIGSALSMASMGMSVMSIIFMRRMKNVHFTLITFSFGIYSTVISLACALALSVFQLPQGRDHILIAIALACLVFVSQTCTTIALKYEQAGPVSLTRTSNIIFGFIWQYLFLGVSPDLFSIIGASIIVVGVVLTALRKWVSILPENNPTRVKFACILR